MPILRTRLSLTLCGIAAVTLTSLPALASATGPVGQAAVQAAPGQAAARAGSPIAAGVITGVVWGINRVPLAKVCVTGPSRGGSSPA